MNLKNNYLWKKLLKWSSKQNNFNIYNVAFKKKKIIKTHGGITLHLHTNNLNMIYSSWDIKCDRLKLVILGHFFFCLFTRLKTPKIQNLKKWKNLQKKSSFYTCVPKITIMWCRVDMKWDRQNCHFGPFFALLPDQNFVRMKKNAWETLSLYKCVP